MYSLFCESLNKVQMKLMKLQSYTDSDLRFEWPTVYSSNMLLLFLQSLNVPYTHWYVFTNDRFHVCVVGHFLLQFGIYFYISANIFLL